MQQALMARYFTDNQKPNQTKYNDKQQSLPKKKETSWVKSLVLSLLMVIVFIGVFFGGLFADHYFHFLNAITSSVDAIEEIEGLINW